MAQLPDNTFIQDFQIANAFGMEAVKDTYKRAQEWRSDVGMYAALCFALNYWCWTFWDAGKQDESEVYGTLYHEAVDWGYGNFKGDDFSMFHQLID